MESLKKRKNKSNKKQVQNTLADSEASDENIKNVMYNHSNERLLNENKQEELDNRNSVDRSVFVEENKRLFRVNCEIDLVSVVLLFCSIVTRMYRLEEPKNIV